MQSAPPRGSPHVGALLLALVTALWGSTFAVIKDAVASVEGHLLVALRFAVAAAIFAPWLRARRDLLKAGLELGLLLWLGYATQAVGLETTTANRSAFITSTNVLLIPLLLALSGAPTKGRTWLAAGLALLGVGLLSFDGAPPNRGDLWTVVTAIVYALYILRLEGHGRTFDTLELTAMQLLVVAVLAALSVVARPAPVDRIPWLHVLYLGILTTALTTWLQTLGQQRVGAAPAAVLYTLEPVWAMGMAYLLLGETLQLRGWLGAALILVAMGLSLWDDLRAAAPAG